MRSIHIALRFLVGIVSMTIFMALFGYTWGDVFAFLRDGLNDLVSLVREITQFAKA